MYLLWAFHFDYAKGPVTRKEIPLLMREFSEGLVVGPAPFKCSISARSQAHEDTIRSEFSKTRDVFSGFEHGLTFEA